MTVYVDQPRNRLGRMLMCHMVADTPEELVEMAQSIGLRMEWIQYAGTWKEHFDVAKGKRLQAIQAGAVPVSARQLVDFLRRRRER